MFNKLRVLLFLFVCLNIFVSSVDGVCYNLNITLVGGDGYEPDNELVMIRFYSDDPNATSPVLYEFRTKRGVGSVCVEPGMYWVDVRNIWVKVNISDDLDFTFPFELYEDSENYTGDPTNDGGGVSFVEKIIVGVVLFIIFVCIVFFLFKKRR